MDEPVIDISNIPDESAAPDVGSLPKHYGKIYNLAGDDALCETVRLWLSKNIRRFEEQPQRKEYVKDGGIADINDRMWRVALNEDTANSQTKDTLSDVTSPVFRVAVRSISAAETSIMFADENLPAEFEPEINTTEYTAADGKEIAKQQLALEQLTFDEDKRIEKIRELNEYVNKDGMRVAMIEWIRETRDIEETVPVVEAGLNENGTWKKVKVVNRKRVVKDWPSLSSDEIPNWYFDALIPELENQRVVAQKGRVGIEELYAQQEEGYLMNVGKLTRSQLYMGETTSDKPQEDRQRNAGEDGTTAETGELIRWRAWGLMPIDEKTTPKTGKRKAKWDSAKTLSTMYEAVFAGDIHSDSAVCLKLVKLPHRHRKIPAKIIRSHRDNKGAFSVGFGQMMASLYWQACANLNQAIDNVTERNWAPLILKGTLNTRDLTFRKNKLIKIAQTSTLERMDIPDTTAITMEMYRIIREMIAELVGATKPVQGEYAGARATATENTNVVSFAIQPLEEKTAYFMDQLFPWMYEMDSSNWRQYGDPETVLRATHDNKEYQIYPTTLYGPIKTKVTAMARFKRSVLEKQAITGAMQNAVPMLIPAMGMAGQKVLGREYFRVLGIPKAEEIFPLGGEMEASAVANRTVREILILGGWVEPQSGENHNAQLIVLRAALREFASLPDSDRPPKENFDRMRQHIAQRENMAEQEQAQAQMPQQGGGGESPPAMEGQATGDMLAASQGGQQA